MAVLSYGKPKIEIAELDADDNMFPWVQIDVPKDGTTSMETQEGDNTEYLEEGGGLVDSSDPHVSDPRGEKARGVCYGKSRADLAEVNGNEASLRVF